jgi:hypothetical protein
MDASYRQNGSDDNAAQKMLKRADLLNYFDL